MQNQNPQVIDIGFKIGQIYKELTDINKRFNEVFPYMQYTILQNPTQESQFSINSSEDSIEEAWLYFGNNLEDAMSKIGDYFVEDANHSQENLQHSLELIQAIRAERDEIQQLYNVSIQTNFDTQRSRNQMFREFYRRQVQQIQSNNTNEGERHGVNNFPNTFFNNGSVYNTLSKPKNNNHQNTEIQKQQQGNNQQFQKQ
ncbi:hypothetical protein [Candidatus Deianiraea vastatrix]|uniref:Uncharacterized protein n=1 Tax=Candidatus Deianiraea vastatrix TaxID=2163644 RepID=A0A5B8XHP0_9RICK|nr:hypothetical protein [Candidatus Deianiraea vastatrix]QED23591.1 hypothetical protein Deia_00803 [Candidatus Deianiraea vastatrix]